MSRGNDVSCICVKLLYLVRILIPVIPLALIFMKAYANGIVHSAPTFTTYAQDTASRSFTFLFYNAENLFDAIDDTITDDQEFLPDGARRWTYTKYYRKLHSVAKVILSAGDTVPPALIGLCEIENIGVAGSLVSLTPLSRYDYGIVHFDSKDSRGIDICLLYNREVFTLISSAALYPERFPGDSPGVTRPVLYAKMQIENKPLHLLLNHWPSRRGGVMAAMEARKSLADYIIEFTDSVFRADGRETAIVIAGDLNSTPSDEEVTSFGSAGFVNLLAAAEKRGEGTYKYRGVWQIFDHIIVSTSMAEGWSDFNIEKCLIHSPAFLLIEDVVYPGLKPFPAFDGYRYAGGYSDHLPLKMVVWY